MKKYTKKEAIEIVVRCAKQYRTELDGKNLLLICCNKHKQISFIEFSFYGHNYMHLTGLKPKNNDDDESAQTIYANDFYQKCLKHKLRASDFNFAEDGTTHLKLSILPSIICKNLNANIIGDYNSTKPRLYTEKIAGNVHGCIGFVFDSKLSKYVPNTMIQEDTRNLTNNDLRIIAIYRKDVCANFYEEITYKAKKIDWTSIKYPEELKYLLGKSKLPVIKNGLIK